MKWIQRNEWKFECIDLSGGTPVRNTGVAKSGLLSELSQRVIFKFFLCVTILRLIW